MKYLVRDSPFAAVTGRRLERPIDRINPVLPHREHSGITEHPQLQTIAYIQPSMSTPTLDITLVQFSTHDTLSSLWIAVHGNGKRPLSTYTRISTIPCLPC
jgi:hypothetical protein